MEKISVIVPVYNKEKYVENTLNSILNQTYRNLEIIVINDGSTDNSKQICEEKALVDNRIIMINTENYGAGAARNLGLSKATGKYISFIDSDDYIIPEYYEVLIDMIRKNDADIAECKFVRIKSFDEEINQINHSSVKVYSREEKLLQLYGVDNSLYINTVIMCNKLFKRELFEDTGILYPTNRLIDDEFIIYHLIYNSKKIVTTNQIMYGYVQSQGSIMRKEYPAKRVYDTIDVYDGVYDFFKDKNIVSLEYYILLRYLKYCVELLVKTNDSNMKEKNEVKNYIKIKFEEKWNIILKKFENKKEFEEYRQIREKFYEQFN